MSAFTINDARWIAQKAVRHKYERDAKKERDIHEPSSDRPSALAGKEEELLVALRQAEEAHGQALVKLEEAWAHIEQRQLMILRRVAPRLRSPGNMSLSPMTKKGSSTGRS